MSTSKWGNMVSDLQRIDYYFQEYVFGFMKKDIEREIQIARSGKPAGNFLCALALLCYTEAMGTMIKGETGNNYERFNEFFKTFGQKYEDLLKKQPKDKTIYDIYRSKMAHVYFATECEIFMLNDKDILKYMNKKDVMGLGMLPNTSKNYFCVEQYFIDFHAACKSLYDELIQQKRTIIFLTST